MFKKKILLFSPTIYPGFEFNDLNLFKLLEDKNYLVSYAVKSNNMFLRAKKNLKKKIYKKDLVNGFPGFDIKLKKDSSFKNVIWIESWSKLKELILQNDVFVTGNFRDAENLILYARRIGKITIVHSSPANLDIPSNYTPNLWCAINDNHKLYIEYLIKHKKICKINKNDEIISTGSTQYDFINKYYLKKKNFFYKYNLKSDKPLFLFIPSAPQHHSEYYQYLYKKICSIVSRSNNILIKLHPTEIHRRKNFRYAGSNSQEYLAPKIKVLEPKDLQNALIYCKAVISVYSTIFMDTNYYKVPLVYVNRYNALYNSAFNQEKDFKQNVYQSKIKKNLYGISKKIMNLISERYKSHYNFNNDYFKFNRFTYLGLDLHIDKLENFLKNFSHKKKKVIFSENVKKIAISIDNFLRVKNINKQFIDKIYIFIIYVFRPLKNFF